ncbi:MAG: pirin family protein, partial [Moraxellaceae bacterium]
TYQPNHSDPRGVGQHPHKGFETVTIAYQGEVAHRDSSGGGGVIKTGDVQWMTAGSGVLHEEFHSPEFSEAGGAFEMVQLWVNLPAKDKAVAARYQHLVNEQIPVVSLQDDNGENDSGETGGTARLIAGDFVDERVGEHVSQTESIKGLGTTFTPINLWDIDITTDKSVTLNIPKTHNLLLLVMRGHVVINSDNSQPVGEKQLVTFAQESGEAGFDQLRLLAVDGDAKVLLMSGEPINEPVVGYGPFVMNSDAEIRQAILDFNAGKFGSMQA